MVQYHPGILRDDSPMAQYHPGILRDESPMAQYHPGILRDDSPMAQYHPGILRNDIPMVQLSRQPAIPLRRDETPARRSHKALDNRSVAGDDKAWIKRSMASP